MIFFSPGTVQVSNFLKGRDVILHAENGVLGYGGSVQGEEIDPDYHDAGGQFIDLKPGASFFERASAAAERMSERFSEN